MSAPCFLVDGYPKVAANPDTVPEWLKPMPWAVWIAEPREGQPGKFNKAPRNPRTGRKIGADKSEEFGTYEEAVKALATGRYSGFGVLLADAGVVGVDIDEARETLKRETVKDWVREAMRTGVYVEQSPSGDGLRAFMRGKLPPGRRKDGKLETYDTARFLTVTGRHLKGAGRGLVEAQELVEQFAGLLGPGAQEAVTVPEPAGAEADPAMVEQLAARMAEKEPALWRGDWKRHESPLGATGYESQSDADLALCGAIAREAVKAGAPRETLAGTVAAVFGKSGLIRDKWTSRLDYRERTIRKALADVAQGGEVTTAGPGAEAEPGAAFAEAEPGDILAGRLFAQVWRGKLKYVAQAGRWLRWGGTRWVWCACGEEMAAAKELADRVLAWAVALARQDAERHKKRLAFALRLQNLPRLEAMIALARSEEGVPVGHLTELDPDPWLLGVRNGVVDLKTGGLLAPDPGMLITRQCAANYDPEAQCPQWERFLDSVFDGDAETVAYIQRALGYTLTGTVGEEVLLLCFGHGANGKSVFANVVSTIMADYAQAAPPTLLTARRDGDAGPRNDIARLCGARAVQANELQQGDRLDEQVVKMLAGREMLSARFLHREYFDFWPTAKPWLRTNHRPVVTGDDDGIWRRLHLIPFRRRFTEEERDPWIEQKLLDERDGILAWMVRGCLDWKRGGGLRPSQTVRRESAAYRKESDLLGEFLDDRTERAPDARVAQGEMYAAWKLWNDAGGTRAGSKASFSRKLTERGHTEARSNGKRYYAGLALRPAGGPR